MSLEPPRLPEALDRVGRWQRRPWRQALMVYAAALIVATHWPALVLAPGSGVSDKVVHALAFGALTILLWRTGWFSRRVTVMLLALAWAAADEITQGLPFIRRHVSWPDGIANGLGVLVASAWLWVVAPIGGAANRARLAVERFAFDQLWVRPGTWLGLATIGVAAAGVGALLPVPLPGTTWLGRAALAGAFASGTVLAVWWRRGCHQLDRTRPCFACGASCRATRFDEHHHAACPVCGVTLTPGQWRTPSRASTRQRLKLLAAPLLTATMLVVLAFAGLILLSAVYPRLLRWPATERLAPRIAVAIARLPPDLSTLIDFAAAMLAMAGLSRLYRRRLARSFDQAERCRRCGHDLRGTPVAGGRGRCSECGAGFEMG